MREISQINIDQKQTAKRLAGFVLLGCLIAISMFAEIFTVIHAGHEHDHNGTNGSCASCAQIQNAESLMKQLGAITGGAFSAFAALFAVAVMVKLFSCFTGSLTLTGLKIRMNH